LAERLALDHPNRPAEGDETSSTCCGTKRIWSPEGECKPLAREGEEDDRNGDGVRLGSWSSVRTSQPAQVRRHARGVSPVRRLRAVLSGVLSVGLLAGLPALALAAVPTLNFTQGTNGLPVPAPAAYQAVRAIYTETLTYNGQPLGQMNQPQDVYIDNIWHNLWVVDTGNNRVIELAPDPDQYGVPRYDQVLLVIGWPNPQGPYVLKEPKGVCVGPDGVVYVADTGHGRIAAFAPNGTYLKDLNPGASLTLRQQNVKFVPDKVAVDERGTIYVAIAGQPYGLAEFNSSGQFLGFFAPNALSLVENLRYRIGKLLQTQEQKAQQAQVLPPEVNNVYVGADGYIYTTSVSVNSKQIRRLNVVGTDTLNVPGTDIHYGLPLAALPRYVIEAIIQNQQNQMAQGNRFSLNAGPLFVSIGVDKNGIITALDQLTSFVFQYTRDGMLLYTFGGLDVGGGVLGLFQLPTAVAVTPEGYVVVSDGLEQNLQVFEPTSFAQLAQQASLLDYEGRYIEAQQYWQKILDMDTNYDLAHDEMGQGYLAYGELQGSDPSGYPVELSYFAKAIQEFYLANDKQKFGTAFGWYRHVWMRMNFTWIFLCFLGFWLAVYLAVRVVGRRVRERPIAFHGAWVRNQFVRMVPMAWRVIKHPSEAFFQLKYEGQGTLYQGLVLIGVAYLVHLGNLVWTNFDFSQINRGQTNLLYNSTQFILPLITWIAANYLVGDLYEGEANLAEIITGSAYAMLPFIVLQLPYALFSHALVPSDGVFKFLNWFQRLWLMYLFFTQVRVLHNLEWGEAIKASVMTLVGIGVIWTMFLIVTGLGQQAYAFIREIIQEIMLLRS
jgi:DNA-binding beta-propeller fold protein YncE